MRWTHFESLRPVCPRCLFIMGAEETLELAEVAREDAHGVLEGRLVCPSEDCRQEYPIIDGVPILVPDLRTYVIGNLSYLLARDDLSEGVESLLGDAAGPTSLLDSVRQSVNGYAWDHYAAHDPQEPAASAALSGAAGRCLQAGLEALKKLPEGPLLDLGCATGGASFALAQVLGGTRLVVGLDASMPMLRIAQRVLQRGEVSYPRRRVGMVYDRRTFSHRPEGQERVDFWLADASTPPFASGTFAAVAALNLLDCLPDPPHLLAQIERLLQPGGGAVLTCPYDWSANATPAEYWLGGHSQRGEHGGAAEPMVRRLLTPGGHERSVKTLTLEAEIENHPWQVRVHDRALMTYSTHLLALRRGVGATTGLVCDHHHHDHHHEHEHEHEEAEPC